MESAKAKKIRTEHFLATVRAEERVLQLIVNGLNAEQGRIPYSPNPVRRAEQRVAQMARSRDVPFGTLQKFIEEERAKDKNRIAREREARKEQRRLERPPRQDPRRR